MPHSEAVVVQLCTAHWHVNAGTGQALSALACKSVIWVRSALLGHSTLLDTSALCLDETFLTLVKIVFQTPDQWPYVPCGPSCWLLAFTLSFVTLVLLTSKPSHFPNSRLLRKLLPATSWHLHCLCDHSHLSPSSSFPTESACHSIQGLNVLVLFTIHPLL